MGMEYSAKLIVGLPYEGFEGFFTDNVAGGLRRDMRTKELSIWGDVQ